MALDAGAHKAVGNKSSSLVANVFQGLAGVAKFAVEHPMASIALAGAGTFIVGAFGLVSPFVGIMGGVVSVTTLMNSGGSQRADH